MGIFSEKSRNLRKVYFLTNIFKFLNFLGNAKKIAKSYTFSKLFSMLYSLEKNAFFELV
jgi:hypothetical protein